MFWKDAPRLRSLSLASKLAVSLFLVLAGIGYIFGFLNILTSYQMTDGEKGLSVKDVQMAYYGSSATALGASIDGTMRQYFSSDNNYNVVNDWLQLGPDESTFGAVQRVFDSDCIACHNSEAYAAADVALDSFSGVEPLLAHDTGKSISRLIGLTHTHLMATLVLVFLLVFVFSFSSYANWVKFLAYTIPFLAIALAIGSWWLAKLAPGFAILVIIGGASLGVSFGALSVLGLWDTWLGKKE